MSRIVKTCPGFALSTLLLICAAAPLAWGQQTTADAKGPSMTGSASLSQAQIDEIIRKFAAKETQFRQALNSYAFKRDARISRRQDVLVIRPGVFELRYKVEIPCSR